MIVRRTVLGGLLFLTPLSSALAQGLGGTNEGVGAVFALTNATAGNAVVRYRRGADGSLEPAGTYATGGLGTGAGVNSQNAVVVTDDHRFLLAVNPGSHSISSFRIRHDGLQLVQTVPSGGVMPTSIAVRNGLVVVLNAGQPNNVSGFQLGPLGRLSAIPGFTPRLSAAQTNPAQVAFSYDGDTIIVTERATNMISSFSLDDDQLDGPFLTPSAENRLGAGIFLLFKIKS